MFFNNSIPEKLFYKIVLIIAVIIYGITAYNSHGYYHADEHYQIVEFAGLKLGTHNPGELAWEFDRGIRPSIQPSICFIIIKLLRYAGISDPYSQMTIIRFLTAMLAILIIRFFSYSVKKFIKPGSFKVLIILSFFLWFLPAINIRFSSETWSGLALLAAIAFLLSDFISGLKKFLITGALLGLSFLFRFQAAFLLIGLFIWLIFIKKEKKGNLFAMFFAGLMVLTGGIILDSWFYNKSILTFWNYLYIYYIENNQANFGTSPWYFYIYFIIKFPGWPIGILILISIIFLIIKKPKNIFLFCLVPFIIIHSFVQHKEERFLFPLVNFIPVIVVMSFEELQNTIFYKKIKIYIFARIMFFIILSVLILLNIAGITVMAVKSSGIARMEISRFIHNKYSGKNVSLVYCPWSSPYNPWQSLPSKFYIDKNVREIRINSLCDLNDSLTNNYTVNLLVIRKAELDNDCKKKLVEQNYIKETQSISEWILYINKFFKGIDESNVLILYSSNKPSYK
jgi:GPI mannosyltransferase 3